MASGIVTSRTNATSNDHRRPISGNWGTEGHDGALLTPSLYLCLCLCLDLWRRPPLHSSNTRWACVWVCVCAWCAEELRGRTTFTYKYSILDCLSSRGTHDGYYPNTLGKPEPYFAGILNDILPFFSFFNISTSFLFKFFLFRHRTTNSDAFQLLTILHSTSFHVPLTYDSPIYYLTYLTISLPSLFKELLVMKILLTNWCYPAFRISGVSFFFLSEVQFSSKEVR